VQEVSFLLPDLLALLLDCASQSDQTLASMSMRALIRLTEVGGDQFKGKDWTTLLEHIRYEDPSQADSFFSYLCCLYCGLTRVRNCTNISLVLAYFLVLLKY